MRPPRGLRLRTLLDRSAQPLPTGIDGLPVAGRPVRILLTVPLLDKVRLSAGTKYTELAPKPDNTGRVSTEEELANWPRVIPIMKEILQDKRLAWVLEDKVPVTELKDPLEDGWQQKVRPSRTGSRSLSLRPDPSSTADTCSPHQQHYERSLRHAVLAEYGLW
jgi:hypothetical protein